MALQDDYIRTALRVPRALHKALHEAALGATRTFNAEIIARLEASFKAPMDLKREQLLLFINEVIDERIEMEAQMQSPDSKAIDVLIRGKKHTVNVPVFESEANPRNQTRLAKGPGRSRPKEGSVNKVILVGNLGRDPEAHYLPDSGKAVYASTKPQTNKGPVKRARGKPPK